MPIPQNEIVPVLFVYIYRHTVIGLGKRSPLKRPLRKFRLGPDKEGEAPPVGPDPPCWLKRRPLVALKQGNPAP
jgi:hypothetical protein